MRTRWLALAVVACFAGCAMQEVGEVGEVGAATEGVHNGDPSSHQSVGILFAGLRSGDECTAAGAFLSPHHFIVSGCGDESSDLFVTVPDGTPTPRALRPVFIVHEAPTVSVMEGGELTLVRVLVTEGEVPIAAPVRLAAYPPKEGDVLTITGFGGEGDGADFSAATEGGARVVEVSADGDGFTFIGIDGVLPCTHDSPLFDVDGDLVGLTTWGAPRLESESQNCFAEATAVSMAPLAAWADDVLTIPLPEPTHDAGENPGTAWEFNWSCSPHGGEPTGGPWLLAFLALLAWRLHPRR